MKTLRRYYRRNTDYFITAVTYHREPLLLLNTALFWQSWATERPKAWVLLPDHFHAIINSANRTVSAIVHGFKVKYAGALRRQCGPGRVWQNRFWDHIIRDDEDLKRHLDYIHHNPVKHGFTSDPFEYEHSSLLVYTKAGYYECDWCVQNELEFEGACGE